jgi:phosphatidylinositol dimannoside acyltransferase
VKIPAFIRRFLIRGVLWRQGLNWAVRNMPHFIEPSLLVFYSAFFFAVWPYGRRNVMRNLQSIFPDASTPMNLQRAFRIFVNFAWTIADTAQFESGTCVDWELPDYQRLRAIQDSPGGAIILTAHMGNYDVGSHLFARKLGRSLVTVRAPEPDPDTEEFAAGARQRAGSGVKVRYTTTPTSLAIELVQALQRGEMIAIQGDRVVGDAASIQTTLFGEAVRLPTGPFALAMATRVPIFPLFVARVGLRRYRVITHEPIHCAAAGRDRQAELDRAFAVWRDILESTVREYWFQWFAFDPFMEQPA